MYKKRANRVIARNIPRPTSGQITVFMILGLLVLFVFIFVLSLSSDIKKGQLQEVQEKALTKTFKKEALRIFVEDCLTDELEKGLILIGKQGRLWNNQPGGTRSFEEGISGVTVGNDQIFYGMTPDPYLEYKNAYPCSNESSPSEFCKYSYPNTKVGFGSLELKTSTIQNDLRRYLLNRTVWCVSEFTKNNISSNAVLEPQDMALDLSIQDSGIDVKVHYPLKLSIGNEEFFHLSEFDFFYPTRFKTLLDTAVSFPLRMDWQYLDFNYTKTTLQNTSFKYGNEIEVQNGDCLPFKNYFFCRQALFSDQYASLGVEMSKQSLPNGDDLFIFTSPSVLNSPELYTYQFARQNRPPALDYVHRLECPAAGYDYLVIKNDPELGIINLTLSALDPDEDKVNYVILSEDFGNAGGQNYVRTNVEEQKTPYQIRAYASDEHSVQDWQDVRVLVDRPLELGISLFMPYKFRAADGKLKNYDDDLFPKGVYVVSEEDPVFIKIQFPEKSSLSAEFYKQQPITLHYENKDKTEKFDFSPPASAEKTFCLSFPGMKSKDCSLFSLKGYENYIKEWKDLLEPTVTAPHFQVAPAVGKLNLSFNANYCALFDKSKSAAVTLVVNECVPHRNPEHPWAYPNHNLKYDKFNFNNLQGIFVSEEEINPFEATHSCCIGVAENPNDWQIADPNYPKPCFINPEPGCYGQVYRDEKGVEPYTTQGRNNPLKEQEPGLVVEIQQQFCDGNRGNTCEGQIRNELYGGRLICGNATFTQCRTDIPVPCQGQPAFSLIDGAGWCSGTLGCQTLCNDPIAYLGTEKSTSFSSEYINSLATKKKVNDEDDINFDFKCGCTTEGQICDNNFDGKFKGVCQADNSCVGDA